MNTQGLLPILAEMASLPGVVGCALVEVTTGMVWESAGTIQELTTLAEATSDYWRLYQRLQSNFDQVGELRACVMMHATGRITLLPCGNDLLLVTITLQNAQIDWAQWQQKTRSLSHVVNRV